MKERKNISRGKQVALNYIVSLSKEIGIILIGLLSRSIFLDRLGIKYIGVTALFSSVVSSISLANLGIGKALGYILIPLVASGDEDGVKGLYKYSKKVFILVAAIIFLLGVAAMPVMNLIINEEDRIEKLYLCYLLYLLSSIVTYASASKGAVFGAYHKMRVTQVAEFISYSLATVLQIVFLIIFPSYEIYLLMMTVGNIASVLYIHFCFRRDFPEFDMYKGQLRSEDRKSLFIRVKDMFFTRIFNTAVDMTDNALITRYVGLASLGMYNNYTIIFSNMRSISKNIYSSMESVTGSISAVSTERESYILYRRELFGFHGLALILMTCCFCLSQDFMTLYAGKENLLSMSVIAVVLFDIYFNITEYALAGFYNTGGYYGYMKYIFVGTAILNIIVSVILGIRYGLLGIFIGTITSRMAVSRLCSTILVSKKTFGMSPFPVFAKNLWYTVQFTVTVFLGKYLFDIFSVSNYAVWFIKAVLVGCYAVLMLVLLNIRNKELWYFYERLKNSIVYRLKNR